MKILCVQSGQTPLFNIAADRKEGKQGDACIFPQHMDDEVRISNFQKGTDLLSIGSQILI